MTVPRAPRLAPGRLLALAVVGLVLAAALLWGASRGTWLTATWDVPLRGRVVVTATGAETEPVLVPWALLSLAAVAGLLATSGWGRRVVGVVVALAGLWALLRGVSGLAAPSPADVPGALREGGRLLGVAVSPAWPLLGAAGGLVLAGVGVLVVATASRLPRLGARYDAPGSSRRVVDPDQRLWAALDAGEDPTAGEPAPEHPAAAEDAVPGAREAPEARDGAAADRASPGEAFGAHRDDAAPNGRRRAAG